MGCTSSSSVKDPEPRKRDDEVSTARSRGSEVKANRHSSMYTTYAEPPLSESGLIDQRLPSTGSLAAISKDQVQLSSDLQVNNVEETIVSEEIIADDNNPQPQPQPIRSPSKGSLIRDGVYYSESELEEGVTPWQPKYWTPERIGKWVEDTEFPEGMRFVEVKKTILAGVGKKAPSSPNGSSSRKSRPASNSIG